MTRQEHFHAKRVSPLDHLCGFSGIAEANDDLIASPLLQDLQALKIPGKRIAHIDAAHFRLSQTPHDIG